MTDHAELVVTTQNIRNDLSWPEFLECLAQAIRGSDAVCLQEVQRRDLERALARLGQEDAWTIVQAKGGGSPARQATLLRRARLKLSAWSVITLSLSRLFPSATRHFLTVVARDLETGRLVSLGNVHLVPHADDDRGGITDKPRRGLVISALDQIVAWVRVALGVVIVTGDFNTHLKADLANRDPEAPVERLARVGAVNTVRQLGNVPNTHGANLYDQAYVKIRPKAGHLARHRVLAKRHSDHRGYRIVLRLTYRKGRRA